MGETGWFEDVLYPLQDAVLRRIAAVDTGYYLSGGTAAARAYLNHRYSDDLDLFVNDDPAFGLWADRLVEAMLTHDEWVVDVDLREARFVRCRALTSAYGLIPAARYSARLNSHLRLYPVSCSIPRCSQSYVTPLAWSVVVKSG